MTIYITSANDGAAWAFIDAPTLWLAGEIAAKLSGDFTVCELADASAIVHRLNPAGYAGSMTYRPTKTRILVEFEIEATPSDALGWAAAAFDECFCNSTTYATTYLGAIPSPEPITAEAVADRRNT